MSCTHEQKEGGPPTPCTAKDGHDDDHCRGQAAAAVKPPVVSAPAVLTAPPSNAAAAATATSRHVVWFGEEVPVDKRDRANEFEPVADIFAAVTAAAAAVGTIAPQLPSALSPTQAHARLAAFSYRNRRLRPVNEDDPISLEPLDMSTAFPLIDARGVVTAFNAFR